MTKNRAFKKAVRARMAETGEHYTQAARALSPLCSCRSGVLAVECEPCIEMYRAADGEVQHLYVHGWRTKGLDP